MHAVLRQHLTHIRDSHTAALASSRLGCLRRFFTLSSCSAPLPARLAAAAAGGRVGHCKGEVLNGASTAHLLIRDMSRHRRPSRACSAESGECQPHMLNTITTLFNCLNHWPVLRGKLQVRRDGSACVPPKGWMRKLAVARRQQGCPPRGPRAGGPVHATSRHSGLLPDHRRIRSADLRPDSAM